MAATDSTCAATAPSIAGQKNGPPRGRAEVTTWAARGLYTAIDGSWRQADASTGVRLLYRLKERERWTLLDKDRAIVVHPKRPAKILYPDGRVEEIASKVGA